MLSILKEAIIDLMMFSFILSLSIVFFTVVFILQIYKFSPKRDTLRGIISAHTLSSSRGTSFGGQAIFPVRALQALAVVNVAKYQER